MKRKLALLMAAVMSLSLLPTANVFADSTNSLSSQLNIVSKESVLFERGVWTRARSTNSGPLTGIDADIDYGVNGTDLVIKIDARTAVPTLDTLRVGLTNAKWFFRGEYDNEGASVTTIPDVHVNGSAPFRLNLIDSTNWLKAGGFASDFLSWVCSANTASTTSVNKWPSADVPAGLFNTYDTALGAYSGPRGAIGETSGEIDSPGGRYGNYVRYGTATTMLDALNANLTNIVNNTSGNVYKWPADAVVSNPALVTDNAIADANGNLLSYDVINAIVSNAPVRDTTGAGGAVTTITVLDAVDGNRSTIDDVYDAYMVLEGLLDTNGLTTAGRQAIMNDMQWLQSVLAVNLNAAPRLWDALGSPNVNRPVELPYVLAVERDETNAVVTVLPILQDQVEYPSSYYWEIRIPIVIRTTGSGDVKVSITSSTGVVSNETINLFSQTSSTTASTRAYIDDEYAIARNDFDLDRLVIQERRLYSIGNDTWTLAGAGLDNGEYKGTFTLRAPTGFEWKDPNALNRTNGNVWNPEHRIVNVGVEPGLYWQLTNASRFTVNGNTNGATVPNNSGTWSGPGYSGVYSSGTSLSGLYGNTATVDRTSYAAPYSTSLNANGLPETPHNDYRIYYLNQGLTTEDRSVLVVELYNIRPSTDLMGKLYIEGLGLTAEDNAKIGDVLIEIRDDRTWAAGVTDEKNVKVAERREWDILFKTIGNIPTLVNGRYDKEDPLQSTTEAHQAARVRFEEYTVNAWWSDRQTTFTLSEGAKFRMVDFYDSDKLQDTSDAALHTTRYTSTLNTTPARENNIGGGVFVNDGVKHGPVTVNNDTITIDNIKISTETKNGTIVRERAWIEMDLWISIQSGVTGDIKLACGGSAIPVQSSGGTIAPITIAKAVNPVNVTAKVTDVKIGYQYQPTYDIIITETAAGMLQKDKEVYVSVSDLISTDMYFAPETKVTPTAGNIKLKNINNTGAAATALAQNTTAIIGTGGTVSFTVDMASSIASTITLSNVAVKLDRTVPETNKYTYKVIAWGPAVAPNYTFYRYNSDVRDKFNTPGIMAEYIKVVSSADDKSSILSQEVRVTIGETYFTVNGTPYDMDAAAYISTASNSTMVPVRFISNAFGISDDQVIWDDANKTVTIAPPNRIVQFTAGSPTMLLNGTPVTMYSPDMLQVSAEIVGDRCYVPFRAMGEAFGVSIEWDAATQTAIYNPGAVTAAAAEAAAAETTATTAS